jgi:hypothetical protein
VTEIIVRRCETISGVQAREQIRAPIVIKLLPTDLELIPTRDASLAAMHSSARVQYVRNEMMLGVRDTRGSGRPRENECFQLGRAPTGREVAVKR